MSTMTVGTKLVELARQGKGVEAVETLYAKDIVSVEAASMPGMSQEMRGIDAIRGKNKWWVENHEVHSAEALGPFPHGDRFATVFRYDVTNKQSGQRMKMEEVAVYTVRDDKIVREEFFYTTG